MFMNRVYCYRSAYHVLLLSPYGEVCHSGSTGACPFWCSLFEESINRQVRTLMVTIFNTLLLTRISKTRDQCTLLNHWSSSGDRSCVNQIVALCQTLKHRQEFKRLALYCFINLRAVYDSVCRKCLWTLIQSDRLHGKLSLLRKHHQATGANILVYSNKLNFVLSIGIRQDCLPLTAMFSYAFDGRVNQSSSRDSPGVQFNRKCTSQTQSLSVILSY